MNNLSFTVIVPVLNGKAYLKQCLDSILQQSPSPEIIIIDGGSNDGSLDIIRNYKQYISYWESGLDTGIANAFNRGLQHANGDILSILNCDDFWESDTLAIVNAAATEYVDTDIFLGQCRLLPKDGQPYVKIPNMAAMKRYMSAYHPSTFVRKKAYDQIGLYNEHYKLAMDSEWMHRAMKKLAKFQYIHTVLANMRLGGISDIRATEALREYRQSVITNNIAPRTYAHFFFWAHRTSKMLDNYRTARAFRRLVNRFLNHSTEYAK